jgi:hypothetical protein
MALLKIVLYTVDRAAADTAYTEMTGFIALQNPNIVNKQPDTVLYLNDFLTLSDLSKNPVYFLLQTIYLWKSISQ